MPQPTANDVHVNRPLTDVSVAYIQSQSNYVASAAFPMVRVERRSDQYFVYSREDWYRTEAAKRAPGTESPGSGWNLTTGDYRCDVWSLHKDVDDQIRANQDAAINMDRDATEFVTQHMMIRKDLEFSKNFFQTGLWGEDFTPGTKWDVAVGSNPLADMRARMLEISRNTGLRANTAIIGPEAWNTIEDNPQVTSRIKTTSDAFVTEDLVKAALGLDRLIVARSVRNSGPEGGAANINFMHSDAVLLMHVAPNPGLLQPSAGYTFVWSGFTGASDMGLRMKRFRMEDLSSDRIEIECAFDFKLVAPELGAFIHSVNT